ncbi:MAG: amidohydrolase family protein, partial [Streptomycetaceae bacterium]|nr:amidohydrolase family protein [Streptomycetaceae bacterium]
MDDLVVRGGTVADGTGAPPRTADIAIAGGRIRAVGDSLPRGRRELDADGLLVAPGWVDVHTHYDGHALWDPLLSPSSGHGVTTVVAGNCGVGVAPVRPADRDWTVALMEGVEDIPGDVLRRGLPWGWETFPQYLDSLDTVERAVDVATQVPHAAVRVYVMGERGIDHEAVPTPDEIARMGEVTAEALSAGALGFSTSRSVNHKSSDGRLTPTLTATEAELLGIAAAVGRLGTGVFEAVFDDADVAREFALLRRICQVSGRPLSVTTLQRPGQDPAAYRAILRELERANADGLFMRGQVAARPVGLLMSPGGRVNPLLPSAAFRDLRPGPGEDIPALLRHPETRARILAELDASGTDLMARFPHAYALEDPPRWTDGPGPAITRLAADQGVSRLEAAYDVLAAGRMIYVPVANYVDEDLAAVREMLVHPWTVPGLGDGGAHCTMIADFDFPTF